MYNVYISWKKRIKKLIAFQNIFRTAKLTGKIFRFVLQYVPRFKWTRFIYLYKCKCKYKYKYDCETLFWFITNCYRHSGSNDGLSNTHSNHIHTECFQNLIPVIHIFLCLNNLITVKMCWRSGHLYPTFSTSTYTCTNTYAQTHQNTVEQPTEKTCEKIKQTN